MKEINGFIKKFRMSFWAFILVAVFWISGCGENENAETSGEFLENNTESEYVYAPTFYTVHGELDSVTVYGNEIYYATTQSGFYKWNMESDAQPEKLPLAISDKDTFGWKIQPDGKGNCYLVYNAFLSEEAETDDLLRVYLAKYDTEGNEIFHYDVSAPLDVGVYQMAVDAEGRLFTLGGGKIALFNADGTYQSTFVADSDERISGLVSYEDGTVYCVVSSLSGDTVMRRISFEEGITDEKYENVCMGNQYSAFMQTDVLSYYDGRIYYYDRNGQKAEALLELMNSGVGQDEVQQVAALSDGRIVLALYGENAEVDGEIVVLTKTERSQLPEKETITLGTFSASHNLMRVVARFNRENAKYRIEVKEYYDYVLDTTRSGREEARTALNMDIISGRCPDILNIEYSELENFMSKGLLEDLNTFLKESENLQKEDILENVVEAYTFEDKLIALPNTVQIRTIVGRSVDVSNRNGWTLEEMMDFVSTHSKGTVFAVDAQTMLEYCLMFQQSRFINWERYTCDFDTDEFCDLLEFSKNYSIQADTLNTSVWGVMLNEGDADLHEVEIKQAEDVSLLMQMFGDSELAFVGFPTTDGRAGCLLEAREGAYAISSKSEYKDVAWNFMEMLLMDTAKPTLNNMNSGFPVVQKTCDRYFELAMEEPYKMYDGEVETENGNPVRNYFAIDMNGIFHYVPLPEETEPIVSLLNEATVPENYDEQILTIIEEEAAYYFAGETSPEKTAKLIQDRVSVYLAEKR